MKLYVKLFDQTVLRRLRTATPSAYQRVYEVDLLKDNIKISIHGLDSVKENIGTTSPQFLMGPLYVTRNQIDFQLCVTGTLDKVDEGSYTSGMIRELAEELGVTCLSDEMNTILDQARLTRSDSFYNIRANQLTPVTIKHIVNYRPPIRKRKHKTTTVLSGSKHELLELLEKVTAQISTVHNDNIKGIVIFPYQELLDIIDKHKCIVTWIPKTPYKQTPTDDSVRFKVQSNYLCM